MTHARRNHDSPFESRFANLSSAPLCLALFAASILALGPARAAFGASRLSEAIATASAQVGRISEGADSSGSDYTDTDTDSDRIRERHGDENPGEPTGHDGRGKASPPDRDQAVVLDVRPDVVTSGHPHPLWRHAGGVFWDAEIRSCDRAPDRASGRSDWAGPPIFYAGVSLAGVSSDDSTFDRERQLAFRAGAFAPAEGERFALEAELALGHFDPVPEIASGIEDVFSFTAGGAFRTYGTRSRVPVGVYGTAGVRGGLLRWDYASPLWVDDGYDVYQIRSDHVTTWTPYAGAGVTFFRDRPLQVDLALLTGIQFYGGKTGEGLLNDVFETDTYVQLRLGLLGVSR